MRVRVCQRENVRAFEDVLIYNAQALQCLRFVFAGIRHAAGGQHLLTASVHDGIADSHAVVIAMTCPARICHACHITPLFDSLLP